MMRPADLIAVAQNTWGRISPTLNSVSARAIIDTWLLLLPAHAVRMKTTVQQASWAGLTSMVVIGRAMILYPDFLWDNINNAFPNEFNAFFAAGTVVGGDIYYGFNKNLEAIKSTLYKNLSYVCKELFINGNCEESLKNYRGWTNHPREKATLDLMIAEYIRNHGQNNLRVNDIGVLCCSSR